MVPGNRTAVAESHWELRPVVCPVCGSARAKRIGFRGGAAHHAGMGIMTPIVRCRRCHLIYPNPTPFPRDHSHYSDAAGYFAVDPFDEGRISAFRSTIEHAANLLSRPSGRMLDIGCGCGEALVAASRIGWEALGVEPSEDFARIGQQEYGLDIRIGRIEDLSIPASTFDLILLAGVLEHVYDPVALLGHARAALVPGGLLYLDVPNERSLFHACARMANRARGRDWSVCLSPTFPPYHVSGFSSRSLRTALDRAGFATVELRSYPIDFAAAPRVPNWAGLCLKPTERVAVRLRRSAGLVGWARRRDP